MKKMMAITLILIVALILISGCIQQNETIAGRAQGETTNTTGKNESNSGGTGSETTNAFSDFLTTFSKNPEYKAVYDFSTTGEGATVRGKYTLYFKGDKSRMDIVIEGVSSRTWMLPLEVVVCTKFGETGEESCFKQSNKAETPKIDIQKIKQNQAKYTITTIGPRTIAGETGNCWKVIFNEGTMTTEAEYCGTTDGILLYSKTENEGIQTELKALQIERTVNDADLIPPAAEEIPQMES